MDLQNFKQIETGNNIGKDEFSIWRRGECRDDDRSGARIVSVTVGKLFKKWH